MHSYYNDAESKSMLLIACSFAGGLDIQLLT